MRSGHEDDFARTRLPKRELWPDLLDPPAGISYPARLNAAQALVDETVRSRPQAPALSGGGFSWTYAELSDQVDRIAHVLRKDLSLKTGSRVLLRGFNHPMLAACWLAIIKAGCIAVTTMPLLRARELSVIAQRARIDAALCEASLLGELQQGFEQAAGPRPILTFSAAPGSDAALERAMRRHPQRFAPADTSQDDVAIIAFTSGTTGQPKGTMHFHRDLLLIADVLSKHLIAPRETDVFIGTPPLAFT